MTGPNHDDCPHSGNWAETVENLGCGLIFAVFLLSMIAVCGLVIASAVTR